MNKSSRKKNLNPNPTFVNQNLFSVFIIKNVFIVDNRLRPLMSLLKEFKGKEIYRSDPRTFLRIKGLDNIYYKTRKPSRINDVCKRFKPALPYFKMNTCNNISSF
jgi:hypothetical protein